MSKVTLPDLKQLQASNDKLGLGCSAEELLVYQDIIKGLSFPYMHFLQLADTQKGGCSLITLKVLS